MVAILEARLDKYEKGLAKARGQTNRQFNAIERRGKQMETRMAAIGAGVGRSFATFGKGLIAAFAARASVGALKNFSDAATRIDNSLKVAGLSGEALEKTYADLRDSATKNAVPIETLVELYSRAAMAADNLGASQEDLKKFTDNVAVSMRVSGKSATESAGALLQLAQLMSGSVVQAQEYNSLIDGAYPLLQAVAAGLKEAGGDVGKLTQLVKSGKVPTKAFFDAFQAGAPLLEEKVAGATFTVDQAIGNLNTALTDVAREFNHSTGASKRFAGGINNLATEIADFDVSGFIQKIQEAHGAVDRFFDDLGNAEVFDAWNRFFGLIDGEGNVVNLDTKAAREEVLALEREVKLLQETIAKNTALGFDNTEALARLGEVSTRLAQVRADAANMSNLADLPGFRQPGGGGTTRGRYRPKTATDAVSLSNYAPPSGDKTGGRSRKNEWQREIEQIKERTAAIQAETAAMMGINPLVDDYGYALEKARAKQDLLTAAKKAGIAVTPELEANIEKLAEGYSRASVEAEKLAESQDKARRVAEDFRDLGRDVMGGFIQDLVDGRSAADALASALSRIGEKLLDIALNDFWGGGGGPGIFGAFLGAATGGNDPWAGLRLATGGRVAGPGTGASDSIPAMLSDGEYVVNAASTKKFGPLLDAINSGRALRLSAGGIVGAPQISKIASLSTGENSALPSQRVDIHIDVTGARGNAEIMEMVERGVHQGLTQFDQQVLPHRVNQIAADPHAVG